MIKSFAARSLAIGLVVSLMGCASAPSPANRPLKIASWNLEHLSEDGANGCRPRTDADYGQLKAYAERLDADVIAFEEVESVKAAARVFDHAKYVIVIEERPHGQAFPCRGLEGRTLTRQAVGFAIRRGLTFERKADLTALQLGDRNLRSGVDIVVRPRGHAPIRLLAVHLKSGCASGSANDACAVLRRQIPVLESWIDGRAGEETRFAVLGDFNRRLALPGDAIWADLDDGQPANADLSLAAGGQGPKCDPRYKDFIDHIVLDRRATADRVGFEELTYAAGAKRPSDHCPVAALLN